MVLMSRRATKPMVWKTSLPRQSHFDWSIGNLIDQWILLPPPAPPACALPSPCPYLARHHSNYVSSPVARGCLLSGSTHCRQVTMSDRQVFESSSHQIRSSCSQFLANVIRISQVTGLTYEGSDSAGVGGYTNLKGEREACGRVLPISRRARNCVVHVKRRAEK